MVKSDNELYYPKKNTDQLYMYSKVTLKSMLFKKG